MNQSILKIKSSLIFVFCKSLMIIAIWITSKKILRNFSNCDPLNYRKLLGTIFYVDD